MILEARGSKEVIRALAGSLSHCEPCRQIEGIVGRGKESSHFPFNSTEEVLSWEAFVLSFFLQPISETAIFPLSFAQQKEKGKRRNLRRFKIFKTLLPSIGLFLSKCSLYSKYMKNNQ